MQDMENDNKDRMLKKLFSSQKQEIRDNGFTRLVMQKLPEKPDRSWIVWVFTSLGLILSLALGLSSGSIQSTLIHLQKIPIYYLITAIFSFPFASSLGLILSRKRHL